MNLSEMFIILALMTSLQIMTNLHIDQVHQCVGHEQVAEGAK